MIRDPMLVESVLGPAVQTVTPKEPAERKTAWITVSVLIGAGVVLGLGGLTPASIYAAAPSNAPAPEAIPIAIGLVQQASNLGQFAGPTALGWFIDQFGWSAAPVMTVPVALFGLATATLVRDGSGRKP